MGNTSTVSFLNPITQVVYPNYTLTASDPISPKINGTGKMVALWLCSLGGSDS